MADKGELLLLGDKVVPVTELLNAAQERLGYPEGIACDRWRLWRTPRRNDDSGPACARLAARDGL